MFYLLLAAQLTILFTLAASGWVKLNAYFRSFDVRWVFTGLACAVMSAWAIAVGCIYFELWSPPYILRRYALVDDEESLPWLFAVSCAAALILTTATIVGLRRTAAGIFAPSRARAWRYRKLAGLFTPTLLSLAGTIAVNDWICRRELASWRAEGERLLDDLATRYPPVGDQETALEQYDRVVEQSRVSDKSINDLRKAIRKGTPWPPFPKHGDVLLQSLAQLQPTPPCNLPDWLDKQSVNDVSGVQVGYIEDVLVWRQKSAGSEDYWWLMRVWSETVERLARDPTTHFDEWLVGVESRIAAFHRGAIVHNPRDVAAFRADSWEAEPDYFAALADRLQWMEARNLLLMSDVGMARYEHPPYHDLWMYLPDRYPTASANANSSVGFRMQPSFWKETKRYHDGMRRIRKLASLPVEEIPRAILTEYGRSPTVDEQLARALKPDSIIIDMPLIDGIFFESILNRLKACMIRRLTKTSLACTAFALENGVPPDRLSDLVPKYLTQIPIDPFSGRAYCFQRSGKDFKIYSVDVDCRDDGGAFAGGVDGDVGWELVVQNGRIQVK